MEYPGSSRPGRPLVAGQNRLSGISQTGKLLDTVYLGDSYIQNFHLGRYFVGYSVRNFVL